ncbi:hypothetical protein Aperf_G00000127257 [Anoplocephala perfoliata]
MDYIRWAYSSAENASSRYSASEEAAPAPYAYSRGCVTIGFRPTPQFLQPRNLASGTLPAEVEESRVEVHLTRTFVKPEVNQSDMEVASLSSSVQRKSEEYKTRLLHLSSQAHWTTVEYSDSDIILQHRRLLSEQKNEGNRPTKMISVYGSESESVRKGSKNKLDAAEDHKQKITTPQLKKSFISSSKRRISREKLPTQEIIFNGTTGLRGLADNDAENALMEQPARNLVYIYAINVAAKSHLVSAEEGTLLDCG